MLIAASQTKPTRYNTEENIRQHLHFIEMAARHAVQLLVFPEMSLTGYELEAADELSFSREDARLEVFRAQAALHTMMIIAGAPVKIAGQLHIGSFVILPDGNTLLYTKQFLHTGEEQFFTPNFDYNPLIETANERISLAICADITNPAHPAHARSRNTTLYIASIFYTPGGIAEAYSQLGGYAKQHGMNILMANYGGASYALESAGQSAFWNAQGQMIGNIDDRHEGLLIVEYNNGTTSTTAQFQPRHSLAGNDTLPEN